MRTRWGRRLMSYSESMLSTHGCLYTFGFLYFVSNILIFLHQAVKESEKHNDFQRYVTALSRGAGSVINVNAALVLLLASRSALGLLRSTPLNMVLPIDKAMPDLHRIVGFVILLAALLHTGTHLATYFIKHPWSPGWKGNTSLFITGSLLLASMLVVRFVARPAVLHASYELFYRTHVGGSVVLYVLLAIHGLHNGTPSTWKYIIGPVIIYLLDITFRTLRKKKSHLMIFKHSAACQGNIVKIRIPREFHYQAGQYAEIKVPLLSRYQWHPFTIASAPHEPEIVFYIKAVGDWTKGLYKLFENRAILNNEFPDDIEIHIRGPYGAPAQHVGQFDRVILIGGGVGATPFCSVVKDAYYWIKNWIPRQYRRNHSSAYQRNRTRRHQQAEHHGNPTIRRDLEPEFQDNHTSRQDDFSRQAAVSTRPTGPTNVTVVPGYASISNSNSSTAGRTADNQSWHLLTTNVISEGLISERDIPDEEQVQREVFNVQPEQVKEEIDAQIHEHIQTPAVTQSQLPQRRPGLDLNRDGNNADFDVDTIGRTTMYTARDYYDVHSQDSISTPSPDASTLHNSIRQDTAQRIADIEAGDPVNAITRIPTEQTITNVDISSDRRKVARKKKPMRRNSLAEDEDRDNMINGYGMESYYGNSSSAHRHSMDYITVLNSAYNDATDEVFQRSLDMMLSMSFGSVSLMRNVQYRLAQRNIREGRVEAVNGAMTSEKLTVDIFRNPRIILLLYLRSVTVNMLILWLLIIRYTIAGAAFAFGELHLFVIGIQLYSIHALIAIDLAICVVLVVLFSLPSFLEVYEIGAAPWHGLELFVLTPIALFGIVVDSLSLRGVGGDVDSLFNVFHILIVWPILTILVLLRLLRVIGERITQFETLHSSHATTRAVDFFWTAPTAEDDCWLVKELSTYADMKELRLHRYLTREQGPPQQQEPVPPTPNSRPITSRNRDRRAQEGNAVDLNPVAHTEDGMSSMRTNHGRPNWEEIFNNVAERSENNSTIGVFFCGPMSMGKAVQAASMGAMQNSIVRGLQSGIMAMRGLEEIFGDAITANEYTGDLRKSNSTAPRTQPGNGRGCNITIVFKRESFT